MAELSDDKLIFEIKNNASSPAFEEIVNRYEKIFYNTVHKFNKSLPQSDLDDLMSDLYIVLNKAVLSFNSEKQTKFSTWACHHSYWHCLNKNKKNKIKTVCCGDDELYERINHHNKEASHDNSLELAKYAMEILDTLGDKRIAQIFNYRYIEGGERNREMNWAEIAKRMKMSVQQCYNLESKGKKILRERLKKT